MRGLDIEFLVDNYHEMRIYHNSILLYNKIVITNNS